MSEKSKKDGEKSKTQMKSINETEMMRCQTCMGIFVVRKIDEKPSCYGISGQKDVPVDEIKRDAQSIHVHTLQNPSENSEEQTTTTLYLGHVFWGRIGIKSSQKKGILVRPKPSIVCKIQQNTASTDNAKKWVEKDNHDSPQSQSPSEIFNFNSLSRDNAVWAFNKMKNNASSVANNFEFLVTNLGTNFVPRFMDASLKVVTAGAKFTSMMVQKAKDMLSK